MKRIPLMLVSTIVVMLGASAIATAQWYRGNLKETLRRLEEDTDRFTKSLDSDLDHSALNGTRAEDEINRYVHDFEEATDHLKNRFDDRQASPGLAREVLGRGPPLTASCVAIVRGHGRCPIGFVCGRVSIV